MTLAACNNEDSKVTGNEDSGKVKNISDSIDSKIKNREDLNLKEDEIGVLNKMGTFDKVKTSKIIEDKYGIALNLPNAFSIINQDGDYVHIEAPNNSQIELIPDKTANDKTRTKNLDRFLASYYEGYNFQLVDLNTVSDEYISKQLVYLVEYQPTNKKFKKVLSGLIELGEDKYYTFDILLGNNSASDEIVPTVYGIFASMK